VDNYHLQRALGAVARRAAFDPAHQIRARAVDLAVMPPAPRAHRLRDRAPPPGGRLSMTETKTDGIIITLLLINGATEPEIRVRIPHAALEAWEHAVRWSQRLGPVCSASREAEFEELYGAASWFPAYRARRDSRVAALERLAEITAANHGELIDGEKAEVEALFDQGYREC
jgi:hypothetical protein